jgi:hypothetical protein
MDDLAIIWFVVLLKVQKKVAIWFFIVSGLQGKQFAPEHEIKRSFAAPSDPRLCSGSQGDSVSDNAPLDDECGDTLQQERPEDDEVPMDKHINAELQFTKSGDEALKGKVKKRKRDFDGRAVGGPHKNPCLDSSVCEVELSDGTTAEHAAGIIAENMHSQRDAEGRQFSVLQEIADHRKTDKAVVLEELAGNRTATKGWDLKVEWKDGTTSWVPLKDLKASNPVEVAEHAIGDRIREEPAFRWWVPEEKSGRGGRR